MKELLLDWIACLYMSSALFLTTTFVYFKTSVTPINKIYHRKLTIIVGCLLISVTFSSLYQINSGIAQIISFLYPPVFFSLFENQRRMKSFSICFILSAFTRIVMLVPSIVVSMILVILNYSKGLFFSLIIIYTLMFILSYFLLKIKRLRKGIQFFQNEKYLGLGLIISGIIFAILGFVYTYDYTLFPHAYLVIIMIGLFISGFGLYLWIRRSITAHYRERLQLKSEEHYQELLKEKELENEKLSQSNEFLAKVVHRDNHLMSALNNSINAYFDSNGKQLNDDLLREIQTLAKERGELIEKEQRDFKLLPTTGNLLIDGAVNDLYIKAAAHGIDFNLTVSETVDAIIGKYISQTDLQTLLCDHIKDAIIAVDATENNKGKYLLTFP